MNSRRASARLVVTLVLGVLGTSLSGVVANASAAEHIRPGRR
ncbi:MAG TPA: hypothetical protein VGG08_01595 [Solirubrobacteraceae bacterium]